MKAQFGKKEVELKFTFNSFKYMKDFDLSELFELESKPFKILSVAGQLLLGAANNNKTVKITPLEIDNYIEAAFNEDRLGELVEFLVGELENSSFFKGLQKK